MKESKYIIIQAFLLPDYDPSEKKHFSMPIPIGAVIDFSMSGQTNKMFLTGSLSFVDLDQSIIMPYLMHKFPPLVWLLVEEVNSEAKGGKNKRVVDKIFFINNIKLTNTPMNDSYKSYRIDLQLITYHTLRFATRGNSSYSNHSVNWSDLDIGADIRAICKPYTDNTGAKVKFINSDEVFGKQFHQLKRRYATASTETANTSLLNIVRQAYAPAVSERALSDEYADSVGNIIANRVVGFTVDMDNDSPTFFRLTADEEYSIPIKETDWTKKYISLRFEPSSLNAPISISLAPNSSYMSLITDLGINRSHVKYDADTNRVSLKLYPNVFNTAATAPFIGDGEILDKVIKAAIKKNDVLDSSNLGQSKIAPAMPTPKTLYDGVLLNKYFSPSSYAGLNCQGRNYYDALLHELTVNNVIYLTLDNATGHKVGQMVHLVVDEILGNDPNLNYNLNLAFAGAWKIIAVQWNFSNQDGDNGVRMTEVLGLTRCSKLEGDRSRLEPITYLKNKPRSSESDG